MQTVLYHYLDHKIQFFSSNFSNDMNFTELYRERQPAKSYKFNSLPHCPDLMSQRKKPSKNILGKLVNAGNHNVFFFSQKQFLYT